MSCYLIASESYDQSRLSSFSCQSTDDDVVLSSFIMVAQSYLSAKDTAVAVYFDGASASGTSVEGASR